MDKKINGDLIRYIYNETIVDVLNGFNEFEHEEVRNAYKTYLINNYDSIKSSKNLEKLKAFYLKLEKARWNSKTKEDKQRLLIEDDYLNRLGYLSDVALQYAKLRLNDEQDKIDINVEQVRKFIEEMSVCANMVKDFNKSIATIYLSEGSMDFNYAVGLTDNTSLRVGRMVR